MVWGQVGGEDGIAGLGEWDWPGSMQTWGSGAGLVGRANLVGGAGKGEGAGLVGLPRAGHKPIVLVQQRLGSQILWKWLSVALPASPSILHAALSKPQTMIYSLCFQWKKCDLQREGKVELDGNPEVWLSHSGACLWEALPWGTGAMGYSQTLFSTLEFPGH